MKEKTGQNGISNLTLRRLGWPLVMTLVSFNAIIIWLSTQPNLISRKCPSIEGRLNRLLIADR